MAEARFLLDSNVAIYLLGGLSPQVNARLTRCSPKSVVMSSISLAEILAEADRIDPVVLDNFLEEVPVVAFDAAAAAVYGRVPFRRGRFDRLIAAHALALDCTLVTNNERDFGDIPDLTVENWTLPS